MQKKGIITTWNADRGYGFITPETGGKDIFIHVKEIDKGKIRPQKDLTVFYSISADKQGRACAVNATLEGNRGKFRKKKGNHPLPVIIATLFLLIVTISVLIEEISPIILALYTGASLLTYALYAKDKTAAQAGSWRTSESTLHLVSLVGGWPGALIAQNKLRHKSKKMSFKTVFWITVLINCGAFGWLFTPEGSASINSLIKNLTG